MSKFNIRPQELQAMISKLQQFATQMNTVSSGMNSYASGLGASWRDPQYQQFISSIQAMSRQLKGNQEQMIAMRKQLVVLKSNLERTQREFSRGGN
jgi:hypothetical protein